MKDNLPEINFKEKKEKKGGLIGWLRGITGGSRGAMGQAGIGSSSAMNVGKALGAAKFGASAGLGSFLAGNISTIAAVAAVAVAGGLYVARNAPAPVPSTGAFSSNKAAQDNYVPAILRSQAANKGSSLEMFKETNKSAGLAMEKSEPSKAAAAGKPAKDTAAAEEAAAQEAQPPVPGENMAQEMLGKLQGGAMGSLTSSLGGGSNKFSGMGGFGNKFNQGQNGIKTNFTSGIGSGFSALPKFDQRKKMLAMKGASRPIFGGSKAGKYNSKGAGSRNQLNAMRATQKSYNGTSIDSARSTQDKAWEGSTGGEGEATGGAGVDDGSGGGAGVLTSPSLDNTPTAGGAGPDPDIPDTTSPTDASPWAGLPQTAMMLIIVSIVLSYVASIIVQNGGWMRWIGYILAGIAMCLALYAMYIGIQLMSSYGQTMMGTIYTVGGGLAAVVAGMAFMGAVKGSETAMTLAAMAAVAALIGSMMSSS